MRLFLAIDLPTSVKQAIHTQLEPTQKEYKQFNWIPFSNYHITLHFFGEVDGYKELIPRIESRLFDCSTFRLYGYEADMFLRKNIVLYINFHKENKLTQIVENIKQEFSDTAGILKYIPHITIARYKVPSKQQYLLLKKKLSQVELDFEFEVKEVTLFESKNEGKKSVYTPLKNFTLYK